MGEFASGGAKAATEGPSLALGLEKHLEGFSEAVNASTYAERAGTTRFIPEAFDRIAENSSRIEFNLQDFSFTKYGEWISRNEPFERGMSTNYEFRQIMSKPNLLDKTTFSFHPGH